jgi:hypothetical protein
MSETATKTRERAAARDLERAQRVVEEVLERIKDAVERVGPEDLETHQPGGQNDLSAIRVR